jgi:hypothetical protein
VGVDLTSSHLGSFWHGLAKYFPGGDTLNFQQVGHSWMEGIGILFEASVGIGDGGWKPSRIVLKKHT